MCAKCSACQWAHRCWTHWRRVENKACGPTSLQGQQCTPVNVQLCQEPHWGILHTKSKWLAVSNTAITALGTRVTHQKTYPVPAVAAAQMSPSQRPCPLPSHLFFIHTFSTHPHVACFATALSSGLDQQLPR